MKISLTILLVISFVSIAVFGFFGMNSTMGPGHKSDCIAAVAQDADCPQETNSLDFAIFHVDAFRSFSLTTLTVNIATAFLLVLALFLGLGFLLRRIFYTPYLALSFSRFTDSSPPLPKQEFTSWLALLENSPAVF